MGLTKRLLDEINYNDYIYDIEYEEYCYYASTNQVNEKKETLEQIHNKVNYLKTRVSQVRDGFWSRKNFRRRVYREANSYGKKVICKRNVFHKK